MEKKVSALFSTLALIFMLCGIPMNSLDENSPSFIPPKITLDTAASSIKPGATIHFDTGTVVLVGNMPQSIFQVKVDELGWSGWKPAGAFLVKALSEGAHTLYISTMYAGGIKTVEDSISFSVETQGYRPLFSSMGDTVILADTGIAVSCSVGVTGQLPILYQWYKDAAIADGKTEKEFTILSLLPGDSGLYSCIASNTYGKDSIRAYRIRIRQHLGGIKGFVVSSKNVERLSNVIVTLNPGDIKDTTTAEGIFEFTRCRVPRLIRTKISG
jgi:hypothetical protein